jgi:hypothetical protein
MAGPANTPARPAKPIAFGKQLTLPHFQLPTFIEYCNSVFMTLSFHVIKAETAS